MRSEVAVKDKTEVAVNENLMIDTFKEFGRETSGKKWIGKLLKFKKGEGFVTMQDDEEVEIQLGTRVVAMMPSLMNGWIRWEEGKPVAHEMGLLIEGFHSPKREDLGDNDKAMWEKEKNGTQRDPWQPANYLVMIDADTREIYTFASGSKGGRSALGELAIAYHKHAKMLPSDQQEVPVIELGKSSYQHPDFGKVYVPTFKVVAWKEQEPYMALLTGAEEQEAEEPEATKVTVKKKVAEKPKAKAKGKAGDGKRPVRFA
jgi:hypothetical protein